MNKIKLIIAREYLTRVKKKSFIIMTFLGPILMASLIVVPVWITTKSEKSIQVMVVDDSEMFINNFTDTEKTIFSYRSGDIELIKKDALDGGYDVVLHILDGLYSSKTNLFYKNEPSMTFNSVLESQMNKILFDKILIDSFQIDPAKFEVYKNVARASIANIKIDDYGNEKESKAMESKIIGMFCGLIIYMFIFIFASQVLRGVLEEKTNRIVEVLISSVKPMQLMMGKIVGIALVGLTQYLIWIVFIFAIIFGIQIAVPDITSVNNLATQIEVTADANNMLNNIDASQISAQTTLFTEISSYFNVSFIHLILCFLFYFILGYLIYSALFAAVGSAVDNETDSQQFTLPFTVPLLLTIMLLVPISENPSGSLALWMSMIPLTSPVAMLIRLPSGVPLPQLLLSMALCILFFLFCVWFAAKIYRVGILMYGKKITYRELFKWLRY